MIILIIRNKKPLCLSLWMQISMMFIILYVQISLGCPYDFLKFPICFIEKLHTICDWSH
jgi:hypothetical protein